jgi:hypothetical protein
MRPGACWLAGLLACATVAAQGTDDAALQLADQTPEAVAAARAWRASAELGVGARRMLDAGPGDGGDEPWRRLSLDLRGEPALPLGWRASVAPRVELDMPAQQAGGDHAILTLREAYLSAPAPEGALLDLGRVRARQGVALGYNPTDLFREGAARSTASVDPASLRNNGQGSVMLRGQRLWPGGAAALMLSPGFGRRPDARGLSLDLGATNPRDRALASWSPAVSERASAQFLAAWQAGAAPRWGLNATALAGQATVTYLEWSGGRAAPRLAQALGQPAPTRWRDQLALGATHTTADELALTLEWHHDGTAADHEGWRRLRQGPPAAYLAYLGLSWRQQGLPGRDAVLLHASWPDGLGPGLKLSGLWAADASGGGRRQWVELRLQAGRIDWGLQWQRTLSTAPPGVAAGSRGWLASVTLFL